MLDKLRNAVKKVQILLNINLNIWRLASILGNNGSLQRRKTLSFNDRPGLRACTDDYGDYNSSISTNDEYHQLSGSFSSPSPPPSSSRSSSSRRIERTSSCPSEDDIDKRAEMFINNFRRRLVMERQASLQLRTLNDELDAFSIVRHYDCGKCTCDVNNKLDVFSKSNKLSQFLMGLSEQYTAIRGHLLLMTHIPNLSVAYSLLLQEENQRELGYNTYVSTDFVALFVRHNDNQGGSVNYNNQNKIARQSNGKRAMHDTSIVCEVCHMTGHSKDKCFCVHGYPSWHRLHGKPKPRPKPQTKTAHAYSVAVESSDQAATVNNTLCNTETAGFTTAQCQQLMTMIQSGFKELSAANNVHSGSSTSWNTTGTSATHLAGNVIHFVCHTNSKHSLSADKWILDLGVTDHITPHFELLTDVHAITTVLQHLPNGRHNPVTHDHILKKTIEIGELQEGLYLLHNPVVSHESLPVIPLSKSQFLPNSMYQNSVTFSTCETCHLAKQQRLQFPDSNSVSSTLFEIIHVDVLGPYRFKTHGNCSYFLTIVEDKSRSTWVFLFTDKTQAPTMLMNYITYVHKQFNCHIKHLRSDNGTEFLSTHFQSYLADHGIIHQRSCTYTSQQNGVVERKHKTLLNTSRALRIQASLPISFWGDCILTTTYLLNRTPVQSLQGLSPYQILFSAPPPFDNLKSFGCLCFAINTTPHKDKFSNRSIKCVFLGYPFSQKAYRVKDFQTKRVFVSQDGLFNEHIFHFKEISVSSPAPHLFNPNVTEFIDPLSDGSTSDCINDSPPLATSSTPVTSTISPVSSTSDHVHTIDTPVPFIQPTRQSTRLKAIPTKFQDYVGLPKLLSSSVIQENHFLKFTPEHQVFLSNVTSVPEPVSYKITYKYPVWCEAMTAEITSHEANHTWVIVPFPPGKNVVSCKWLYKVKFNPDGTVE
ncbi:uncharacterized protein LOC141692057 [Apium graveolens]|uniref:uncharacterized protein LOC141692057 n=1 Tax=Apium graveolens TaxID=4045 RepID=UPI003D7BBC7A